MSSVKFGVSEEKLIYLDPHFCQDSVGIRPQDRDYPVVSH